MTAAPSNKFYSYSHKHLCYNLCIKTVRLPDHSTKVENFMHLNLVPGFVYIFAHTRSSNIVKIGSAESMDASEFILNVANPQFRLKFCPFFLNAGKAKEEMQAAFKNFCTGPETYAVSFDVASAMLEELKSQAQRLEFAQICRKISDMGELTLDDSQAVDARTGSALAAVLAYVPTGSMLGDVRTLLPLALSAKGQCATARAAQALLESCGLFAHPVDELVLLNKSEGSLLETLFENTPYEDSWREQLAQFCGFNASARSVGLGVWLDYTLAGPEVVDLVSPLV
jgi:hypothetical protein